MSEAAPEWTYDAGMYRFYNEAVEVVMDEATFGRYQNAYFIQHGIDSRTHTELLAYVTHVQQQHLQAEIVLHHPDYWVQMSDPDVRIIRRTRACQPMQTDETERTDTSQ